MKLYLLSTVWYDDYDPEAVYRTWAEAAKVAEERADARDQKLSWYEDTLGTNRAWFAKENTITWMITELAAPTDS